MTLLFKEPTSAKDFRTETRKIQILSSQLDLLTNIGLNIINEGLSTNTYPYILDELCKFSTQEHGMIAIEVAGVYKVKVSQGAGLLSGSRIASSVSSHITFLPHQQILMNECSQHQLWSRPQSCIQSEWILPIRIVTQTFGFIALASETPTPLLSEAEIKIMQTMAAIIGLSLQPNSAAPQLKDLEALALLTPREKEVLTLIPLGLSNAQIGEKLGITAGTVKIHVERILSKLGLSDRTQAAVKATKMGYHNAP